jgi:hypothetical protein
MGGADDAIAHPQKRCGLGIAADHALHQDHHGKQRGENPAAHDVIDDLPDKPHMA